MNPDDMNPDSYEQPQEQPTDNSPTDPVAELLAELETLRQEIDCAWMSEKSAVELVSEQRQ